MFFGKYWNHFFFFLYPEIPGEILAFRRSSPRFHFFSSTSFLSLVSSWQLRGDLLGFCIMQYSKKLIYRMTFPLIYLLLKTCDNYLESYLLRYRQDTIKMKLKIHILEKIGVIYIFTEIFVAFPLNEGSIILYIKHCKWIFKIRTKPYTPKLQKYTFKFVY